MIWGEPGGVVCVGLDHVIIHITALAVHTQLESAPIGQVYFDVDICHFPDALFVPLVYS